MRLYVRVLMYVLLNLSHLFFAPLQAVPQEIADVGNFLKKVLPPN
jgi:hypothetical protein